MSKVTNTTDKNNSLQIFYKGFRNFQNMHLEENYIIFKVPTPERVKNAMSEASARIAKHKLPLQVLGTGERTKTFIVKTI